VSDVDVAGTVDRHATGVVEARRCARAVHAASHPRGPRQRRHNPACGYLADGVVVSVGDIDIAGAIDRHAKGEVEMRRGAGSIFIAEATDVARKKLESKRWLHRTITATCIYKPCIYKS